MGKKDVFRPKKADNLGSQIAVSRIILPGRVTGLKRKLCFEQKTALSTVAGNHGRYSKPKCSTVLNLAWVLKLAQF